MTRWIDWDSAFGVLDELRRRVDQDWYGDLNGSEGLSGSGLPKMALRDEGQEIVLTAEVPGLAEEQVDITLHQDVLTVRGERKSEVPKGYTTHRRERLSTQFVRSFSLPPSVDPDRVSATVKNGLLTVTIPKAPESQPRQITVRAS